MKKVKLLLIALAIPFFAFSQTPTAPAQDCACDSCAKVCKPYPWEAGLILGVNQYFGDMHCSQPYLSANHIMAGPFIRRYFGDYFALRAHLLFGGLGGNDLDQPDGRWDYRRLKFTSPLTEVALLGEFYPLKERRYNNDGSFKPTLAPYIFAGIGGAFTNPTVSIQGTPFYAGIPDPTLLAQDQANLKKAAFILPFGVGVKYNATERWSIGLEAGYRYAFSDYLDGVSLAADPKVNDGYALANLLVGYRFGDKDTDKDGIVDKCDVCPNEKGLRKFQGCPDTDGDGTPDRCDACPTSAGPLSLKGCPDTDGDGIPDKDDLCPTQPGLASLQGCPDRDHDGIADKDDACPDVPGVKALRGCPDTDGDGITDKDDACPNEPGPASLHGCPDSDGDGIADKDDACPKVAGVSSAAGCPDRDGDGVEDAKDKCPDTPGLKTNDGCPEGYVNGIAPHKGYRSASGCEVSVEELDQLNFAANSVEFYAGTNKLKPSSYKALDRVCNVLHRCPDTILGINVYNDGASNSSNLRAAKLRACAIYAYFLKKKCITKARMQYQGLGDEDPNANYTDAQGKKVGSRVEFQLR